MKRQLLALLCATTIMHAMQTPPSESSALTAPRTQDTMQHVDLEKQPADPDLNDTARHYQRLLNDKSYAERTLTHWKHTQGSGYLKDVHPPMFFAGLGVGVLAGLSVSASYYNWKEASEEATGKNITTGIVSTGVAAATTPLSYKVIRAGLNYTRFLENRVDAATQELRAFADKHPATVEESL